MFGDHYEGVYQMYGVDVERGAVAVIWPDGYIGAVAAVHDVEVVRKYLEAVLVKVYVGTGSLCIVIQ